MKDCIDLVILPLYRCNEDSAYYMFNNLKTDKNTLDLTVLEEFLSKLSFKFNINKISIEGGEISQLSDLYFDLLYNLLKIYNKKITVTTNFVNYNKSLINGADIIDVKFNFDDLENSNKIKNNIKAATSIGKIINVKSLDIAVDKNELENVVILNKLGIKSWEILPFYQTKFTEIKKKDYSLFEKVVEKYLKLTDYMRFSFINKLELDGVIRDNSFPIKTVYITPNSKFGLGNFDKNNNFSIVEYDDIDELEKNLKKLQDKHILLCKDCKYKMDCLAKRYFDPNYTGKSCSGFKNLIKLTKGK